MPKQITFFAQNSLLPSFTSLSGVTIVASPLSAFGICTPKQRNSETIPPTSRGSKFNTPRICRPMRSAASWRVNLATDVLTPKRPKSAVRMYYGLRAFSAISTVRISPTRMFNRLKVSAIETVGFASDAIEP